MAPEKIIDFISRSLHEYFILDKHSASPLQDKSVNLISLTNTNNLYHLVANDLYGHIESLSFYSNAGISSTVFFGESLPFLPLQISPELLATEHELPAESDIELNEHYLSQCARASNSADQDMLAFSSLTLLSRGPYLLTKKGFSQYHTIMAKAKAHSAVSGPFDLRPFLIPGSGESVRNSPPCVLIFGVRCGRRRPLNQADLLTAVIECISLFGNKFSLIIEGTYKTSTSPALDSYIEDERSFVNQCVSQLKSHDSLNFPIYSFIGAGNDASTYAATCSSLVVAPWGAGLTRHLFSEHKDYLIHTNESVKISMHRIYYSWEVAFTPNSFEYVTNKIDNIDSSKDEAVLRLDPSRPGWNIFDNYVVDIESFRISLLHYLNRAC